MTGEDEQIAPGFESAEWLQIRDISSGKTYFQNRRSSQAVWTRPEGIQVVWMGSEENGASTTTGTTSNLDDGGGGLPSLHSMLGATVWDHRSSAYVLLSGLLCLGCTSSTENSSPHLLAGRRWEVTPVHVPRQCGSWRTSPCGFT